MRWDPGLEMGHVPVVLTFHDFTNFMQTGYDGSGFVRNSQFDQLTLGISAGCGNFASR